MQLLGSLPYGLIFVVSAPGGTGKTTLVQKLVMETPSVVQSISFTTREKRPDETDGVHYNFISRSEFEKKIQMDEFLEYVEFCSEYYGTSAAWVENERINGRHVILVIDTIGAKEIQKKIPDAILIFIQPPSLEELSERLNKRKTETTESITTRLEVAKNELKQAKYYDYFIINDDLENAFTILKSILIAEEHKIAHLRSLID